MAKRTPRSNDSNSHTPVTYTRKIPLPSITLDKEDFNSLLSILKKTNKTPSFNIETDQGELTFTDIQFLANQKWPANIKRFHFNTGFPSPSIKAYIYVSEPDLFSSNEIILEHNDTEWISARADELRLFLDQHHNWHRIFHNLKYTLVQGIFLFGLLTYLFITYFTEQDLKQFLAIPLLASIYAIMAFYGILLPRVFPYVIFEPEHPSTYTRLRSASKYFIPAIFTGLIAHAIIISLP